MTRAHFLTYETLMDNEENQVLGFTHVGDFGGMSAAFVRISKKMYRLLLDNNILT